MEDFVVYEVMTMVGRLLTTPIGDRRVDEDGRVDVPQVREASIRS